MIFGRVNVIKVTPLPSLEQPPTLPTPPSLLKKSEPPNPNLFGNVLKTHPLPFSTLSLDSNYADTTYFYMFEVTH